MNTPQEPTERKPGEVHLDRLNGGKLVVRPLSWKDGRDLAALLTKHTGELADAVLAVTNGLGGRETSDPLARQQVMLQQLAKAIMGCTEVADFVIRRTTGLSQEEADALLLHEALLVLTVVVGVAVPQSAQELFWGKLRAVLQGQPNPVLN